MKHSIFIIASLFISLTIRSQSLDFVQPKDTVFSTTYEWLVENKFDIVNNTSLTLEIHAEKAENVTIGSSEYYFCWGPTCYTPADFISDSPVIILPGDTEKTFVNYNRIKSLTSNVGISEIGYCFSETSNQISTVCFTQVFKISEIAGDADLNGTIDNNELAGDLNGNGVFDNNEFAGDLNGTGSIETGEVTGDLNGDGTINGNEVSGDANGNGVLDNGEVNTVLSKLPQSINISIYPNPASTFLHIKEPNVKYSTYSIFDKLGKKVAEGTVSNKIEIRELPIGNYTLRIKDKESSLIGSSQFQKIN